MRYRKHPSWKWLAELSTEQILLEKVREFADAVNQRVSRLNSLQDDRSQSTSRSEPAAHADRPR
jgi:hypothetical protein